MSKNSYTNSFKGVIDTTLRDGQQSPLLFDTYSYRFTLEDKMMILRGLVELGVRKFEFFSPVVSDIEGSDFSELKSFIKNLNPDVELLAHCRCHPSDVERAIEVGFDGLNLYMGASPQARQYSHGLSINEIQKRVRNTMRQLRADYPDMYLRFSVEDCFRTNLDDIFVVYDEIADLVNTLGMPDTVGIATPDVISERIKALKNRYSRIDLECHFHNDRGFALINSLTAVMCGASYIDTSIWGMAERSGITSITGLLFNLFQQDERMCSKYNCELCYPLNVLMGSILKYHVPYNEPVSVTNRTHTAGVHQKAVINSKTVYEAMDLRRFGVTKNQLLLGPLSGWNLIYYFLREFKYYDLTKDQAKKITIDFKHQVGRIGRLNNPESVLMEVVESHQLTKLPIQNSRLQSRLEQLI